MMATTVIGPATGRVKKIDGSPEDSSSDWRRVGSAMGPKHNGQNRGRQRVVEAAQDEGAQPEDHDQPDVEHVPRGREAAADGQHEDHRREDRERHPEHPDEDRDEGQLIRTAATFEM
jgi:hypothetical protein